MSVHYDKPVRELLADCVRDLRSPFTWQDVLAWFGQRYPRVKATTISTHLAGLTEGAQGAHAHLAQYPALVRRIDHGLYESTAHALGRGARPASRGGEALQPPYRGVSAPPSRPVKRGHVLMLGCVKTKRTTPSPARDLYTGSLFTRRRGYAEASGCPWYVLSADTAWSPRTRSSRRTTSTSPRSPRRTARPGAPSSPSSSDGSPAPSRAWCGGPRRGGVRGGRPTPAGGGGGDRGRSGRRPLDGGDAGSVRRPARGGVSGRGRRRAGAAEDDAVAEAVAVLGDPERAVPVPELLSSDRAALDRPGLYSWWVDESGARDLSAGLGLPVPAGLVYAGQAGATRWPSGQPSTNTCGRD